MGVKLGPSVDFNDVQLVPLLAEKWEISPDAKTYTFQLRKGVKFQNLPPVNGREFTSDDVKFSYEYSSRTGQFKESKLPPGKFVQYFEGLEKIETPDANTAVLHLKSGNPDLLFQLGHGTAIMVEPRSAYPRPIRAEHPSIASSSSMSAPRSR